MKTKSITLVILSFFLSLNTWATSFTYNGVVYTITDYVNHYVAIGTGTTNSPAINSSTSGSFTIPHSATFNNVVYLVTSIGDYAFYNCKNLTSVIIPSLITSIGIDAFGRSGLVSMTIPSSITTIGNSAFENCLYMTSITIPNSVTSIGNAAFFNCVKLTSLTIPNSVITIGDKAFALCEGLTSISISSSVTSIGDGAFFGCIALITVAENNTTYSTQNGVLYNKDFTTLIYYPATLIGAFVVPSSVTTIGNNAFYNCIGLTSITIPSSVTSIGAQISFRSGWDYSGAFSNCNELTSISIPNSVKTIGNYAFSSCSKLKYITIPNSVTYIGDGAFKGSGLTAIHASSLLPVDLSNSPSAFSVDKLTCILYVPNGSYTKYLTSPVWTDFQNIVEESISSGLELMPADKIGVKISGKNIIFKDIQLGNVVQIINVNGVVVKDFIANDIALCTSVYISGVYIIKVGNRYCKVLIQ